MVSPRKSAKTAAIFFFISWVGSIAGLIFYGPVLKNVNYLSGGATDNHIMIGALLEMVCAFANIGTGVAMFPIVRRYSESLALGYVALRTLEASVIAVGVLPILAIISLRTSTGAAAGINDLATSMVDFHNISFNVGPNLICGVNTTVMAYALYKSRLVARFVPTIGLIGGPLVFLSGVLQMFDIAHQGSSITALMAIPVFSWEISLASYMFFKGFRKSAMAKLDVPNVVADRVLAAV
jgi:hypothetical protein